MTLPNPILEREARAGQEGFVHYLFTCLLLGGRPPGGNQGCGPSARGGRLLAAIDERCFDIEPAPLGSAQSVIWEMQLDRRHPDEGLRYPDIGVLAEDRLILFELKTQPGSVREGQVEEYLDRGLHHFPGHQVDLIYLTRDRIAGITPLTDRSRYANLTWAQVGPFVDRIWPEIVDEESALAHYFADYLRDRLADRAVTRGAAVTGPTPATNRSTSFVVPVELGPVPEPSGPPSLEMALAVASMVLDDGVQRVYEYPWPSRDGALAFRADVRDAARAAGMDRLDAWVWRPESTGKPLSPLGIQTGIELRLSRLSRPRGG